MKAKSKYAPVSLSLLYYEVEKKNNYYSKHYRITKREKVLLVYLGWHEMNGKKVSFDRIKDFFSFRVVNGVRTKGLVDGSWKPKDEGRKFYYEIVNAVCKFWLSYSKRGLMPEGIEVNMDEVKKIILC